jgi:hypothetical protein
VKEFVKPYLQKLQAKPKHRQYETYLWADYIELLCLANIDGEMTKSDIIDRLSERERDLQEGDTADIDEVMNMEKEEYEKPSRRSEISDLWEVRVADWFNILNLRESLYQSNYPFIITEHEIKRKNSQLNPSQKIYVYLLCCSNLYLFDKALQVSLANCFELLSYNSFKNILPNDAEIHLFGSNPLNKEGRYSKIPLLNKINKLSADLNEILDPRLNQSNYTSIKGGDGGLDLVAWVPTGDNLPSSLIFFAQCACTDEWVSKQHDSSHESWEGRILFKNRISNSIFIPFCFRRGDGTWAKIEDIKLSFLVDRKRLLHYYLKNESISFDTLPASQIIDEIANAREDVV